MDKTFARPLIKNTRDRPFKSGLFDYAAIRKAAHPNPFGIVPDAPDFSCNICETTWNSSGDKKSGPGCSGECCY